MAANVVKPWHKVVRLRDQVRTGELSLQEFAADLFDVVNRTGKRPIYEDPAQFFSLTYATSALRDIVAATADRLRGKSAKAVRQLELSYGGGKTHTMVTLTHLFRDPDALPHVPAVKEFESAMGGKSPKARVAAVCFDKLDLEKGIPVVGPDGSTRILKEPWSVIAYQIAGAEGLRLLHADGKDEERASPPRDLSLEALLSHPQKAGLSTLVLFDEVLMYVAERAKEPATGSLFREQFLNFLQSLTQAATKVDTAAVVVSLLASDPRKDDAFGKQLVADMSNILGRNEDESFMPVGKDDVAEILRRRLLDPVSTKDQEDFRASVVASVKALGTLNPAEYAKTPELRDRREQQYLASFPFDPALMDVFYTKWTSGLPLFQRTRGILRTFAVALRDAEAWDTSPLAGASILLSPPGKDELSSALSDLAGVASIADVDGAKQDWRAILLGELSFARKAQQDASGLQHREIEQAVIATFVHSQPAGSHSAKTNDLFAMVGAGKPDRIGLEKGLAAWADHSWYLDEAHLASAEKREDGSQGLPKTWRLGDQPNLKQMHDDARVNRVDDGQIDAMIDDDVKKATYLDQGAQGLGARVHRLPVSPKDVPSDGEFSYVILGRAAKSESGKPSPLAVRFCDEVASPENPRSAKNAILAVAPDRIGLDAAREKIRDHLAWVSVRETFKDKPTDPVRAGKLETEVKRSRAEASDAIRQAWCVMITRDQDDQVKAFKITVDTSKSLFSVIKEDKRSRISNVALLPELLLPGGQYDLWRMEETRIRVRTLVDAFAERPKLPKMLRRSDLLSTIANGCEQGLFVLSLRRPDGSERTWWRNRIDEDVLKDSALEAVQCAHATLASLDPALIASSRLEGVDFGKGIKISDLVGYFSGSHAIKIEHEEEGWTEDRAIPACPESVVLDAVRKAVAAGTVWLVNGPASIWKEEPPAGTVTKSGTLHAPPAPIEVTALMPEMLPDAWTEGRASAQSFAAALAVSQGVSALPWPLVQSAITGAINASFLQVVPGGIGWPCSFADAGTIQFELPSAGGKKPKGQDDNRSPGPTAAVWSGALDTNGLNDLVEALPDIVEAADDASLVFRIVVEQSAGSHLSPEASAKIKELMEAAVKQKA